MKRGEAGLLLVHLICCGLPLLIVLGVSLAPLAAVFLAPRWLWLGVGSTTLIVGGLLRRRQRRLDVCTDDPSLLCSQSQQTVGPNGASEQPSL